MIQDAAYQFSNDQSLASPTTFPATSSTGHLSDGFYDVAAFGLTGGRNQHIAVRINEAIDTNVTIALALWPDNALGLTPDPTLVAAGGHRYISQHILTQANGDCAVGKIHYLPLVAITGDFAGTLGSQYQWRYLNIFYLCASTTTGKVTTTLVDTPAHTTQEFIHPLGNLT